MSSRSKFTRALRQTFAPRKADLSLTQVFGVPFDRTSLQIPSVIKRVVEYFDHHGVQIEGLFRLSGGFNHVQKLKADFDAGKNPDLTSIEDPHVCASLLKQYLRELPEPLLTFELYDCFLASASVPKEALIETMQKVLTMLPMSHRIILKFLVSFLNRVSESADVNFMTPANIAIVFAPNLLKPEDDDIVTQITDTPYSNKLMELFVIHYGVIFASEPDIPPEGTVTPDQGPSCAPAALSASTGAIATESPKAARVLSNSTGGGSPLPHIPPSKPIPPVPGAVANHPPSPGAPRPPVRNRPGRSASAFTQPAQVDVASWSEPPPVNRATRPNPPPVAQRPNRPLGASVPARGKGSPTAGRGGHRGGAGGVSGGRGGRGCGRGGPARPVPGGGNPKPRGAVNSRGSPNVPLRRGRGRGMAKPASVGSCGLPMPPGGMPLPPKPAANRPTPPCRSPGLAKKVVEEVVGEKGRQRSSTTGTSPSMAQLRSISDFTGAAGRIARQEPSVKEV